MDRAAVYYARTDGSLIREAIYPIMTPNGVGLSPDGRTLYVTETETSRVWSFAITGDGEVEKMPWRTVASSCAAFPATRPLIFWPWKPVETSASQRCCAAASACFHPAGNL